MILAGFYLIISYAVNSLSPKLAGKLQVSTTVIKLIPLILMAIVGTFYGAAVIPEGEVMPQLISNFATINNGGISSLLGAVVATAFAYEGWILATTINQELKDAKKNLPKALIIGTTIVIIMYIIYYIGIAGGASVDVLIKDGATVAFKNVFGNIGGTILNIFVAISCLGTLNGLMLSCIRNMYSLAKRNHGPNPEVIKQVDTATNMPTNSAIVGLALCAIWLFYFFAANLDTMFLRFYDAESANWLIRFLGEFNQIDNTYMVNWFGFDSSELPIVCIYLFYIPIFIKMFKMNDLTKVKRILVPILGILSSPLWIGGAIAVKLYDGGPVLFKQERATINGKRFYVYKLRTMKQNVVNRSVTKNDDRITPPGHFLRRTRIDELPQLLNVLKGDMTFVGPRPEMMKNVKDYTEELPEFEYRLRMKAGLTGYAQITGK